METIQVSTASWTDKGLIESGRFYPKGRTSAEDRLRYNLERQGPNRRIGPFQLRLPEVRTERPC